MYKQFYLQEELDMIKISKEPSKVPVWLSCTKTMIPDFVARDPKVRDLWKLELKCDLECVNPS
jgi:DNA ligase-3